MISFIKRLFSNVIAKGSEGTQVGEVFIEYPNPDSWKTPDGSVKFNLNWKNTPNGANTSPASEDEIAEALAKIQHCIDIYIAANRLPCAILTLRKEVAEAVYDGLIADGHPTSLIAVVDAYPDDQFDTDQNCYMRQLIIASHKEAFKRVEERATDW